MKNKISSIYSSVFIMLIVLSSCFEEDERYAILTEADGQIIVTVPEAALAAPPAGQTQIAQPNANVISGRFAISDNVSMTINLSQGLTDLQINTLVTASGARQEKAAFTGISGPIEWSYPVNTLGLNNAAPATGSSVVLELVASDGSAKRVSRVFSINVVDPLTLAATNPATALADSTIELSYTVPASTTLANISKVELLAKRGVKGTEAVVLSNTHGDVTTKTDKFIYKMPAENPSGALDTMFFRIRATYATGRTVTKSTSVRFVNVPLTVTTTGLTIYNPAVTGTNAARTGYDLGKLAYVPAADPEETKDIKLLVAGLNIGFTSGAGNATRFVKATADDYASTTNPPTFQSLRKLFTAPTAVLVTSVSNVFTGDVYVVAIDGGKLGWTYGILRVTGVTLTPDANASDFITFDFKSK